MSNRSKAADDMRRSWLVQRLNKPHEGLGAFGVDNPFSFGGGLRNGGLSNDAMSLLRQLFSFDYMGASEFEWGAVPKALQGMAKDAADLRAFTVVIPLASVPPNWKDKTGTTPDGVAEVYVICRHAHINAVVGRVESWATKENADLKESLHLTSTLRPHGEWDGRTVGWLELDNGFLFFTDRDMWLGTCELFGVIADAEAGVR